MIDLAARRLRDEFVGNCDAGNLGAVVGLGQLADCTRECLSTADLAKRSVTYSLWRFLLAGEYNYDERKVLLSESDHFVTVAQDPIGDAIDYIVNGGTEGRAIAVIARLADSHAELFPA